jgi:hypothetical protein
MEAQLGGDFSSVHVHTDAFAAAVTRANDARALTAGPDVYFEPDAYAPRTNAGRALLAHELAHVIQQSRPARTAGTFASDALEREAQQAAAAPGSSSVTPGAAPVGSIQLNKTGQPPATTTSIAPKAAAMKPPPAVEQARKLLPRAQQLQEHLLSADRNRTVNSSANGDYVSGTQPRPGFTHVSADEVARQAGRIGHPPTEGGFLDPTRTGEAADVHAEVKHATVEPGVPKAVAKPMCQSCQAFHRKQAIFTGTTETVADPQMVREFKPNGDIVEWYHDGRVATRSLGTASATPGPEETGRTFRRSAAPSPSSAPSAPATEPLPPVETATPAPSAEMPGKVEVPPAVSPQAVAEGGVTPEPKAAAVEQGAATVRVGTPQLTLGRVAGVVGEFAIWMMVDYILRSWGDMRERAQIAELMTANVEPRIKQRLIELDAEAQRLTIENPYATVYANVTVTLRYEGMADEYGTKREGIHDVSFSDLRLALAPHEDVQNGGEVTRSHNPLSGNRIYATIRTATIPLPLKFPETADGLELRQLRFTARKLVDAGITARGYAEAATYWSEGQTERFVQAYVDVSRGPQREEARHYLEEIRRRSPGWRDAQRMSALRTPFRSGPTIGSAAP